MTVNSNDAGVKRPYRSPRRAAQAEATRQAILDAAHDLFLANGYAATSIRSIAEAVDVSDQTIYGAFGDKPSLLVAVGLRVVSGDYAVDHEDEQDRPDLGTELAQAPDQAARTAIAARWSRRTWEQGMLRFESMLLDAAGTDPRAAEIAETMWARKYEENKPLFELAFPPEQLPSHDDPATSYDLFFAIDNAAFVRTLIDDCNWSWDTYEDVITRTFERLFTS